MKGQQRKIIIITIALLIITVAVVFIMKSQKQLQAITEDEEAQTAALPQPQEETQLSAPLQKKITQAFPLPPFRLRAIGTQNTKTQMAVGAPWSQHSGIGIINTHKRLL